MSQSGTHGLDRFMGTTQGWATLVDGGKSSNLGLQQRMKLLL